MFETFIAATFVAGLAAGLLALVFFHRSRGIPRQVRLSFLAVVILGGSWSIAYGLQLTADSVTAKLFWETVVTLALVPFATSALVFTVAFTGRGQYLTRRTMTALAIEPFVVLLALLEPRNGVAARRSTAPLEGTVVLSPDYGTLVGFHHFYTLVIGTVAIVLLADASRRTRGDDGRQTLLLVVAGLIPLVSLAVYNFRLVPLNPAPATLGVTTAMVGVGMVRYGLFDLTPAVRDVVFEELTDAVVVVDASDRIVEANTSTIELLDLPRSPAGAPAHEVIPNAAEVLALRTCDTDCCEVVVDTEAGRRYFEVTASKLDSTAVHAAYVFAFSEVTSQRHAEAQHRALIENSRDMVSVFDADGEKRYASPAIRTVLGYDRDSPEAIAGFELIHPDDRSEAIAAFTEAVQRGGPVRAEYRLRTADGTYRLFEGIAMNLLDDPAVEGIVVSSRDVTDRRRYEQRLRVLNRVLRHDLRNEMNVVLGYVDLLENSALTDEQAGYLDTIQSKAERVVTLSEQTREVVESLPDDEEAMPVDVAAVTATRMAAAKETYPNATITTRLPSECWARAGAAFDDAIDRLVESVVAHSDTDAPSVVVEIEELATPEGCTVLVTIEGDGPGIPAQHRVALMEGTETPLRHLNGFDLWLVNWYVDGVGGELVFDYAGDRRAVCLRLVGSEPPRSRCDLGAGVDD